MLDKSGILDKDLIKLANQAGKMFKKKMTIARNAINELPESESEIKSKLKKLLNSTTNKSNSLEDNIETLKNIVNGR